MRGWSCPEPETGPRRGDHQHVHAAGGEDVLGDASQKGLPDPGPGMRAHDEELRGPPRGEADDDLVGRPFLHAPGPFPSRETVGVEEGFDLLGERGAPALDVAVDVRARHAERGQLRLAYRDNVTDHVGCVTLVYPGEEDAEVPAVSVLSPVGAALLGLSGGQSIRWRTASGGLWGLTAVRVLFQPYEVAVTSGRFHEAARFRSP